MSPRLTLALACVFLLSLAPLAPAQTPAATPTPTISSQSTLVLVPALVRDKKSGQLVFTLKAGDFVLTDDGVPQKLHLEEDTVVQTLALVVLIEAGAASKSSAWHPKLRHAKEDPFLTLPTMIEAMVGHVPHKIAVVGFDSGPELLHDFTPNIEAAADAIFDLDKNMDGDGQAAILDALSFSLDLLRKQPPEYRRAILLLSETHDHGSHTKLEDALRAISDTNTAIYSFTFSSDADDDDLPTKKVEPQSDDELIRYENPNPGPAHGCFSRDPNDTNVNLSKSVATQVNNCIGLLLPPVAIAEAAFMATRDSLQKNIPETVARVTGGEYFKPASEKAFEADLHTLSNHIPNRYILSYQPQSPHPGFHSIKLRTPSYAGLAVSARNGYWADTPAPPISAPPAY